MKKSILMAALGLLSLNTIAQDTPKEEGFIFTTVKENPITSVKNQNRAGTCWCYSGLAFIESELLRMGKGEYDFSEMFIVHNTYLDRADKAVRTHGDVSFSQGGSFYDVIYGMKTFGLVPEEEMRPGVMYGDTLSNHTELTAVSDAVVATIAKEDTAACKQTRKITRFGRIPSLPSTTSIWANVPRSSPTKARNILRSLSMNLPD